MQIIGKTKNPFINVSINIANSKEHFDKSSFQLINFLIEYGHDKTFDLNEQFLVNNKNQYNPYGEVKNYSTNFFNTIFSLEDSFNPKLINKLVESGLKFNPFFMTENNEFVGDILFTQTNLNSDRNIFLFNLYLKQNGLKDFTEKIVQHNTLNSCISQQKLVTAEFLLKHVSIDLQNHNLETPIMHAKNLETLQFLSNYNPSWSQKSALGNDCSFYYSGMQNDTIKGEMLNFYLKELSKDSKSIVNDELYVQKRLEETLVQLVTKDATKVELSTFLKKYKLKNVEKITTKDNKTLGQICVNNEDFARFALFPKTDLYHVDNNGNNIFTALFKKDRYSSETKVKAAKALLLSCLEDSSKNISQETFNVLIESPFKRYSFNLPDWILKDHFLRSEILKTFKISSSEISFGDYINRSVKLDKSETSQLYFDILGNLIKEFEVPLLKDNTIFDKIFETRTYNGENKHYFEKDATEMIVILLKKCESVGKINLEDFLDNKFDSINSILLNLKETFLVGNEEMYETNEALTNANHKGFYEEVCKPFFIFLAEQNLLTVIQKINEDLVKQTVKIDENNELNMFSKLYSYLKLNKLLPEKNIKTNKIKI